MKNTRLVLPLLLVVLAACSATDPVAIKPPPSQSITTLRMQADSVTLWAVGRASQLAVEARDGQARVLTTPALTWTSSAPAVAIVNQSGLVAAVGDGEAVITARSADGASATSRVLVRATVTFSARLSAMRNGMGDTTKTVARASVIVRATP